MRTAVVWQVFLGVLVGAAACSTTTPGTPVPGSDSQSIARSTSIPTEPADSPAGPLAKVDPCDLVTTDARAELGLPGKGREEKIGRARQCSWSIRGTSAKEVLDLSVAVYDTLGVKDIVAKGEVKTIPAIGAHDAAYWTGIADNCVYSLAVSATTRVDVAGTGPVFDRSCDYASRTVKLVEPNLP
ncbi:MAG TPA: DUF3558 domain-containing protein [Actinokineospora sp.]|nr:DUF3558 domain-containing protein [Actinokineospora sp.]